MRAPVCEHDYPILDSHDAPRLAEQPNLARLVVDLVGGGDDMPGSAEGREPMICPRFVHDGRSSRRFRAMWGYETSCSRTPNSSETGRS
jgi:hypothetical protein